MWAMIQAIAFLFCGLDLYLAWVSTSRIGSYCIMCILTYAVNFALLYFAWLIRRRFTHATFFMCLRKDIGYLHGQTIQAVTVSVAFLGIVTAGMAFYPSYWEYSIPTVQASLQIGYTAEGRPWIGARSPKLVIEEYSDYLCFQCAKMHTYLRKLVSYYPDKIRLVHSHFPMDNAYNPIVKESFHEGSGRMALLALYAESHNKFWQMNDLLFQSGRLRSPVGMRALGEKLDMDYKSMARSVTDPTLLERLRADILSGLKHRITATPSFVINGNVYQGVIPAEVLRTVINDD
jgi:protein-disulfide isomerase